MTYRLAPFILASTVLLGSCSHLSPLEQSEAIATKYLEAIKTGDTATAMDLYCHPGSQESSPIKAVTAFTVEGLGESIDQSVRFNAVKAIVESKGLAKTHTDEYVMWVFTPENAIAHQRANAAKFAELGMRPEPINPEEWSKSELCIFVQE